VRAAVLAVATLGWMPGSAGTGTTERIIMDLRFAVFERIARDDLLRRLLVNYADRLDDLAVLDGAANDTCYLTLEWATDDRTCASAEAETVTARAHLPRCRSDEQPYLELVLRRLEAALAVDETDGTITVRRRQPSAEVVESGADTIFRTRTYDVAPVPHRSGSRGPAREKKKATESVPREDAPDRR
jgi:hypothetical protein